MLSKLLKYEFKATARYFAPIYLALLGFALINKFIKPFETIESSNNFTLQAVISFLTTAAYFALIVGVIVMTVVIMIQRFYKNLLSDEGYLSFTLPVETWKHILNKLLISLLWSFLSVVVTICSILILVDFADIREIFTVILEGFNTFLGTAGFFTVPIYMLLMAASGITMIYAAIALGHQFSGHKLIASFGMYCALYMGYQIVLTLFIFLFSKTLFKTFFISTVPALADINTIILIFTFIAALFVSVNFTITNVVLKRKLNLE